MDGPVAGEPTPARRRRLRSDRRWWALLVFLLLPPLVLTTSDGAFSSLVSKTLSATSIDLNTYLPTGLTVTRKDAATCTLVGSGTLGIPANGGYAVMDSTGTDLRTGITSPSVDVPVPATATLLKVQMRDRSWRSSQTKDATCPAMIGAPTQVYATAGDASAKVFWTAPQEAGGSAIKTYTVTAVAGSTSFTCTTGATSCTVTGLTNDTTYSLTVTATNSTNTSAASSPAVSTTPTAGVLLAGVGRDVGAGMALGTTSSTVPRQVGNQAVWSTLSASQHGVCGIRTDGGSLWCWGKGANIGGDDSPNPIQFDTNTYSQVSGKQNTHCAIRTDAGLWCWGANGYGQVGDGTTVAPSSPVRISGSWLSVAVAGDHTCAIDTNRFLWCWGAGARGQLGQGDTAGHPQPVQVGASTWRSVTGDGSSTCAIRSDNSLWCWGANDSGQLANGTSGADVTTPTQVGSGRWSQVQMTGGDVCALQGTEASGALWCWGDDAHGAVGDGGDGGLVTSPTAVGTGSWIALGVGISHSCAIRSDTSLWCWGMDNVGQVGDGRTRSDQNTPVQVGTGYSAVSAGDESSCGVRTDQTLTCWGTNDNGQLGSPTAYSTPFTTAGSWRDASMGGQYGHTCLIDANQALWCGGDNTTGAVGGGSAASVAPPVQIRSGTTWLSVAAGETTTCGVTTDTTLWCWGDWGTPNPQQVGSATGWLKVSAGGHHTCAVKTDGTLWCWSDNTGNNAAGELGQGTTSGSATPVQVGTRTDWRSVAAGYAHTCAVTTGNQLWCWGDNSSGELGDGTTTDRTSPVRIASGLTWSKVAAGGDGDNYPDAADQTCAITTAGSLYCWGANSAGQLGIGTTARATTPAAVGSATYREVSAGGQHTCAVDTSNHVWCWGSNSDGQLGAGSDSATSPRQIAGVTAARVVAGHASTLLLRATALPPATPTGVGASAGTGKATVSWSAVTATGGSAVTGYTVAVATAAGSMTLPPVPTTGTSCDVTGLASGSTYSFWVTATNANGTSGDSVRVSVKIP